MSYTEVFLALGGLGMFLFGMQLMSQGLENAAGNKMKSLLEALTKNKLMGVLLGASITAVIQSSSATTVMVVGFVNAGIMKLGQAMGVIMGANIGTTITSWIVSMGEWTKFLKPSTLAPIMIILGVIVMMFGKRRTTKDLSSIIIGFGILFLGIDNMSSGMETLGTIDGFRNLFVTLGSNPFLGILVGLVLTAIIQSSSASVGILQALAIQGLVPFSSAVYIIMGQNIGTCVTAIISSIGAKKNAKTAALMHLLFNIIGTVIFSVAAILFFKIVNPTWGTEGISATQINVVHTIFNVVTTVLLFPVSNMIVKLAKKISGVEDDGENIDTLHLDDRMLETPSFAIPRIVDEVIRMGSLVNDTLEATKRVLFTKTSEDIQLVKDGEAKVDCFTSGITEYSLKVTGLQISDKEHQHMARVLQVVNDMERVADYCENISEHAEVLKEKKLSFSEIGAAELKEMIDVCFKSYHYALEAFAKNSREYALKVIEEETKADELEIRLRTKHIKRLANNQCNIEAGIVFLDTVVCLERISDHARNIAEEVLEQLEA